MSIWKDTASALGSLYGLGGKPMMSRSVAEQKRLVSSTFRVGTWVMPLKLSLPIEGVKWLYKKVKGGMDPHVEALAKSLVGIFADEVGIELRITEGYRSQAAQDHLYDQGRTRPGRIVTWTRSSKHTTGRAFDVTVRGLLPDQVPRQLWYAIGEVGEALGLKWGGRWRGKKDMPHFEL